MMKGFIHISAKMFIEIIDVIINFSIFLLHFIETIKMPHSHDPMLENVPHHLHSSGKLKIV